MGFFNPLLDSVMKMNLSHSLPHSANEGHYTFWPWHQLPGVSRYDPNLKKNADGSIQNDADAYNKTFDTRFIF